MSKLIRSVIVSLLFPFVLFSELYQTDLPLDKLLTEANSSYERAERAANFQERKNNFNEALSAYLEIEKSPSVMSKKLFQAIGDTYFQLGEYAWSILYYERALQLRPQDELINQRANLAKTKLGLGFLQPPSLSERLLFDHYFSFRQRLTFFFWMSLFTLSIITLLIWRPFLLLKKLAMLAGVILITSGINLFTTHYFAPIYGIFIQSTGLYRAPNLLQPQLSEVPLLMGSKIRVMEAVEMGFWLKVINFDGRVGYVPASSLRLIDFY
ncbi:MAG: tetratricopeptide repeat protein [Candidatus Protochlamydia sp.]|nr:tetratricopeptide repeat protein [Candidatus Protochlamydia sp.]